jgi:AraC family transcriptional regulator of adaptative response/methylated-DNA-[protein]-cysteine methyltransferase
MQNLTYDQMVKAMTESDASYDGRFYVGVHSTGIYCLPSCPAKMPLLKNVVFYASREEAIAAGLRGCKRCHSDRYPDILPLWLPNLIAFMKERRQNRLTEHDLMQFAGVEISTIRRHFQHNLGLTPLAFHRKIRLEYARLMIAGGADYLTAAYDCGWESPSAFRDAFKRQFGCPPGRLNERADNRL